MNVRLLALAALILLPGAGAPAEPERARHPTCTGIYTGAARGVFWCKVVPVHDDATGRSSLKVETEDDVQLSGDALAVTPGGIEWKGPMAAGVVRSADAAVTSAWSALQTGQPPNQADYAAARKAPGYPADRGELTLDLASVKGGGAEPLTVHGTFSARLLPLPGAKAFGEVRVTVTF